VHHDPAQVFLIAALAAGLVILIPVIIFLRNRLFFFDWPPLYEWQQARRQLRLIGRGRVIWATCRRHPASRVTLADAQLAYARYRQAAAQRALDRRRPGRRVAAAAFFGVLAAGSAVLAATHSQQRIVFIWGAAGYALSALGPLLEGPRSMKRLAERMARLQAEIQDCYRRSDPGGSSAGQANQSVSSMLAGPE
jgi:hypothetical protein